jgi:hypothetical protein
MLWDTSEIVIGLSILGAFLLAIEAGFRLGHRHLARAEEADKVHISALQTALLGLMAFLIGFTFAMSVGRFDTRNGLAVQESNSISTTYLRARLLPEPHRQEILQLLHTYVDAWRVSHDADIDAAGLDTAIAATVDLQQQLWTTAGALTEQNVHSTPVELFVHSLNDMIDLHEKRLRALENHIPGILFWLVVIVAVVSLSFVGYRSGLDGRRRFLSTALVSTMIALVLAVILDLDRPRHGFIKIGGGTMAILNEPLDTTGHVASTKK